MAALHSRGLIACRRRGRPQPRQPLRLHRHALGQPSRLNHHVHHVLAPEHPAQLRARHGRHRRHLAGPTAQEALPFLRAAVAGLHHKPGPASLQPLPRLGESENGLACAPGEAESFNDPTNQSRFEFGREIGGDHHLAACRPGKRTTPAGCFYHIPPRAQPDSPPGQRCGNVGNDARRPAPIRRRQGHEAQHALLGQPLARDGAAPQRALLRLVVVLVPLGGRDVRRLSRCPPPLPPAPPRPRRCHRPRAPPRPLPRPRTSGRGRP